MNPELGYNPGADMQKEGNGSENFEVQQEPQNEKERRTAATLVIEKIENANLEIIGSVIRSLNDGDPALDKWTEGIKRGDELGKVGGEYLRRLTGELALKKPDKEYSHEPTSSPLIEYSKKARSSLLNERSKLYAEGRHDDYQKKRRAYTDADYTESAPKYSDLVKGVEGENDIQLFSERTKRANGLILSETVYNYIDRDKGISHPDATLRVSDPETHLVVDLSDLLPNDVTFHPKDLEPTGSIKDIRVYKGQQNSRGKFSSDIIPQADAKMLGAKTVTYGNLSEPGHMLSLMHEISHSWQDAYYNEYGKYPYIDYMDKVSAATSLYLKYAKEENHAVAQKAIHFLESMGIFLNDGSDNKNANRPEFILKDVPIGRPAKNLDADENNTASIEGNQANVRLNSDKLNNLIKDHVDQERDAWANAIRIIRFFRKKGIDLEPQLKTLKDFQGYIYTKLATYDKVILDDDKLIAPTSKKFVRKRPSDSK
jgi:hypothetical protein